MTEAIDDMPSPRELGEMIVNGLYNPETNNIESCIDELLAYMPESFPRKTAELQIQAIISYRNNKSEPKKKKKRKRKIGLREFPSKEPTDDETRKSALRFALNWFGRNDQRYFVRLINEITNNFPKANYTQAESRWIATQALHKYQRAIDAIPTFKTAQDRLQEKRSFFSLKSASTPRVIPEIGKRIDSSESRDKIETDSLKNLKNETEYRQDSTSKVRLSRGGHPKYRQDLLPKKKKLDPKHITILKRLLTNNYPCLFREETGISKATFYRKLKQLEKWELILKVNNGTPAQYEINPRLKNSSLKFLVEGIPSSLISGSTSKSSPIAEKPNFVQDSESHSQSHFSEISSNVQTNGSNCETRYESTSKTAPIGKPDDLIQNAHDAQSHSESYSVSIPSDSEKPRENFETTHETTSKKPSFEELIAKFDPHHIRSHDYLYLCKIQRHSKDFFQQLEKTNWLESKEGMRNWKWYRGSLKLHNIECHFHIYTKKVTIQILEVTSPDPFSNNAIADDLAVQVTAFLEDKYPGLALYDLKRRSRLEIKKTHHAIPNHPIAIRAFELQYNSHGERFGIDNSDDKKELESHAPKYSTEDIDNYVEDCDFKAKNEYWFRDSAKDIVRNGKTIDKTVEVLNKVDENQLKTAECLKENSENSHQLAAGLRSHSELIDSMSKREDELIRRNFSLQQTVFTLESRITEIVNSGPHFTRDPGKARVSRDKIEVVLPRLQALILRSIQDHPGQTRKDLAKNCQVSPGSVNGTIPRLKRKGFIYEHQSKLFFKNKPHRGKKYV
ncbi:hypothetical protein CEE45_01425 [Candidatus Heimdallarchaeota archaeon B3_Heim]|nr:MAG: hypothetical protein CEE45_01425 [Candidatus Heimdallarchaeota archaeon B3_Heim]